MMKKAIATLIVLFFAGCAGADAPYDNADISRTDKIIVAATFYPLAEFARQTGGYNVQVFQIIPDGAEPHEYEPTPKDIVKINSADLFLINGAGLDPWAEKIREELEQKGVSVIVMSDHISLLPSNGEAAAEEHDEDKDNEMDENHPGEERHGHGSYDPHFWLDPLNAVKEVELISESLAGIDPGRAEYYRQNAADYTNELKEIDSAYTLGLASCSKKDIITSHAAFAYLADRYGFVQNGISGISPQEEPSPGKIAALAGLAREKDLKYVFFETLVSPRLADTLANEVGAQTLLLHPVGGLTEGDMASGKNYATLMRENLENLKTALECR